MELFGVDYVGGRTLLGAFSTFDEAAAYVCGADDDGALRQWGEAYAPVLVSSGVEYGYDDADGRDHLEFGPATPGGVWFAI